MINPKFYVCLKTCSILTTTNRSHLLKGELIMTFKEGAIPAYGDNYMCAGMFEIKGICKHGVFYTNFYNEENKKSFLEEIIVF